MVCPNLDDPVNGDIFYKDDRQSAIVRCKGGFTLNSTVDTLNCVNGTWDSSPPTCTLQ